MLSTEDRQQIAEVLAFHAHVSDEQELNRLDEVFVEDAVYDMSRSGMGVFHGLEAIRAAAEHMITADLMPRAHFLTNVIISEVDGESVTATSKGLMIMRDGSLHAVSHQDSLDQRDGRWRINRRVITPATSPSAATRGVS